MEITIVLEPQTEGGFTVYVPSLPGCISQGETKEEALKNIKEAMELYLESLAAHGEKPEIENNTFVSSIGISPTRTYA